MLRIDFLLMHTKYIDYCKVGISILFCAYEFNFSCWFTKEVALVFLNSQNIGRRYDSVHLK